MRLTVLLFVTVVLTLSGCGIKPGSLDAPDPDKDYFPHTYPDPSTDHQPDPERYIRR